MTTIHPLGLAQAIANHEKFELLDVRSRQEFERTHIRGARSVPLRTLQPVRLMRERGRKNPAPFSSFATDAPKRVWPLECWQRRDAFGRWWSPVECSCGRTRTCQ